MKICGLMTCRNEAWILPASLAAALQWLDTLIVTVHQSEDASADIVRSLAKEHEGRILWKTESREEWNEATYRGELLDWGRAEGGTHFAIIDADEIPTAAAINRLRCAAGRLEPGQLIRPPWIHCWRSLNQYRCDDSPFGNARVPLLFRDAPNLKYKADPDGYQLHKRTPQGCSPIEIWEHDSGLGILHLQHARWERVVAKQKRYAEDERRRYGSVRANYAAATDEAGLQLKPVPAEWWPVDISLIDLTARGWQENVSAV